jgi:hypothetical protein
MIRRSIAVAALALLMTNGARADVLFDTISSLGGSLTPDSGSGPIYDSSTNLAASFTYTGASQINSIELLLGTSGSSTGTTNAYLVSSLTVGGVPAPNLDLTAPIGSLGTINESLLPDVTTNGGIFQQVSLSLANLAASLTDGTEYWVLLEPQTNSELIWGSNGSVAPSDVGATSEYSYSSAFGTPDSSYANNNGQGIGPFDMIVSTPEPTTAALLGVGLAGLGYARRRVARKA